jgi:hypothetical protein
MGELHRSQAMVVVLMDGLISLVGRSGDGDNPVNAVRDVDDNSVQPSHLLRERI